MERRRPAWQAPAQSGARAAKGTLLVTVVALEVAWLTVLAYAAHALVL